MVTEIREDTWTIDEIIDECQKLECDQLVADLVDLKGRVSQDSLNEISGGLCVFLECDDPMEGILHLRELDARLEQYLDRVAVRVSIWSEVLKFDSQLQRLGVRRALEERQSEGNGLVVENIRDHEILILWIDAYTGSEWEKLSVGEPVQVHAPSPVRGETPVMTMSSGA